MARDEITKERAEELKRHVKRGFNERNPKLIEELLADHLVDHNRLLGGVDLRHRMARVLEAFEDADLNIDDYISRATPWPGRGRSGAPTRGGSWASSPPGSAWPSPASAQR
jgi:hypothetical protein